MSKITNTTVVYDPATKEVVGIFPPDTYLTLGNGVASYTGTLEQFYADNPEYQTRQS